MGKTSIFPPSFSQQSRRLETLLSIPHALRPMKSGRIEWEMQSSCTGQARMMCSVDMGRKWLLSSVHG